MSAISLRVPAAIGSSAKSPAPDVVLMKDRAGHVIGFEKPNFSMPESDSLSVSRQRRLEVSDPETPGLLGRKRAASACMDLDGLMLAGVTVQETARDRAVVAESEATPVVEFALLRAAGTVDR